MVAVWRAAVAAVRGVARARSRQQAVWRARGRGARSAARSAAAATRSCAGVAAAVAPRCSQSCEFFGWVCRARREPSQVVSSSALALSARRGLISSIYFFRCHRSQTWPTSSRPADRIASTRHRAEPRRGYVQTKKSHKKREWSPTARPINRRRIVSRKAAPKRPLNQKAKGEANWSTPTIAAAKRASFGRQPLRRVTAATLLAIRSKPVALAYTPPTSPHLGSPPSQPRVAAATAAPQPPQ